MGILVPRNPRSDSGQHHFPVPWVLLGQEGILTVSAAEGRHGGQTRELMCVTWAPMSARDMGQPRCATGTWPGPPCSSARLLLCRRYPRLSNMPDPVLCVLRSVQTPPPLPCPWPNCGRRAATASWPRSLRTPSVGKHTQPATRRGSFFQS